MRYGDSTRCVNKQNSNREINCSSSLVDSIGRGQGRGGGGERNGKRITAKNRVSEKLRKMYYDVALYRFEHRYVQFMVDLPVDRISRALPH